MKSNYRSLRRVINGRLALAASVVLAFASIPLAAQDGPGPGPLAPGPGCNLFPAPPSIGAGVHLSYFGPPPSETNPSLVGPVQLLKSGTVDDQLRRCSGTSLAKTTASAARSSGYFLR